MDEPGCSLSISSLLCQEDATDLDLELEDELCQAYLLLKDAIFTDEEYIEELASRERNSFERQEDHEFSSCDGCLVPADNWFKRARSDAIRWILNNGKPWATRLLSTACLSVAAKMEECRVPPLSEMQIEGYAFDSNAVQRMELLLLDTLQWRTNCVTPFDYLSYFRSKFRCEESLHKAIDFIFAAIDGSSLASTFHTRTVDSCHIGCCIQRNLLQGVTGDKDEHYVAVPILFRKGRPLCVVNLAWLNHGMVLRVFLVVFQEHVFSCYSIMTRDLPKNTMTPERLASSEASENYSSITVAIDSAPPSSFSLSGAKRRRLRLPDIH
ncbi:hypothetical protein BHE74_00020433 [Ensete ventricosum]|nr:hypothetical protein BHE74_00020433 [Ensete ventricosum]